MCLACGPAIGIAGLELPAALELIGDQRRADKVHHDVTRSPDASVTNTLCGQSRSPRRLGRALREPQEPRLAASAGAAGASGWFRPGQGFRRIGAREESEDFADGGSRAGGFGQRQVCLDLDRPPMVSATRLQPQDLHLSLA